MIQQFTEKDWDNIQNIFFLDAAHYNLCSSGSMCKIDVISHRNLIGYDYSLWQKKIEYKTYLWWSQNFSFAYLAMYYLFRN